MSPFTKLRTSPSIFPLASALALSMTVPPAAASGPVLTDVSPARAASAVAPVRVDMRPVLAAMSYVPAATAGVTPGPTERAPAACPAAQEAIAGASADKYGEAARHYEQCARTSGDAGLWKKAGMARYSARQYAHAIQALDTYLQATPQGSDAQGEAMLADARKNTGTVRFSVVVAAGASTPERLRVAPRGGAAGDEIDLPWSRSGVSLDVSLDAGQWTAELMLPGGKQVGPQDIQATREGGAAQVVLFRVEAPSEPGPPTATVVPVEVKLSLGPAAALRRGVDIEWTGPEQVRPEQVRAKATPTWRLMPGDWQLLVRSARFEKQLRTIQVRPEEPQSLSITLVRTRAERLRIGLSAGLGGAALGLFAGGLAGALGGRKDYREAIGRLGGPPSSASQDAASDALTAIKHSSSGTLVATSAAGTGLAAITVAANGSTAWIAAEIGVGGALMIAGVAWMVPSRRRYAADAPDDGAPWAPDKNFLDDHRRPELVAAGILGLGAGLAAGATVALVTRAIVARTGRRRAATLTPMTAPRAIGLAIHGSF